MTEETLFHEALATSSPAERAALLDAACAGQLELRAAVEGLLAAHEAPANFLDFVDEQVPDQPNAARTDPPVPVDEPRAEAPVATTTAYQAPIHPDTMIAGRYKLVNKIGEGGMGEVWVAKQSEPVKRKVALKLIKTGMDSKAVLARFEQERQALAMMDHPNIAKVLDGGTTGELWIADRASRIDDANNPQSEIRNPKLGIGQPFFVMELVNGVPLTKFCDDARLTPRERMELFVPICQAVQHAHQKGIIHRDLKPSNILVTLYDGRPVPKIIDFGVAKATGGKLTEETLSTQFGLVVGTLEYMSPEQAGLSALDIDTRADIYSLGVILYELLTGLRPLDGQRMRNAALKEMIRILQEEEPSRPSTRLSNDKALPSLAALRKTEPKRLMAMLRGELDWVVMKCLEKDRNWRYETAAELGRDVQRYLADEAVEARPPSAAYRLAKFVRRHRGPVLAASLVLMTLIAGIAGTTWGLIEAVAAAEQERQAKEREAEQRKVADGQRQLAQERKEQAEANEKQALVEKQIAEAVRTFLQDDLLRQADPTAQADSLMRLNGAFEVVENPTIKELLDRAAAELTPEKIDAKFPGQREVQASILQAVGDAYRGSGEYRKAVDFLERSSGLHHDVFGGDQPQTLTVLNNLAVAYDYAGRLPEAIEVLEQVRDARVTQLGPQHPDTLTSLINLASAYLRSGRPGEAIKLFEQVRDSLVNQQGAEHPNTPLNLNNLAVAYQDAGRLTEAIELLEQARDAAIKQLGADHPGTLTALGNLATTHLAAGRFPEAIKLLEQVWEARVKKGGSDHPDTLVTLGNLAMAYRDAGRLTEAIKMLEKVRDEQLKSLGDDHPSTLTTLHNLAVTYKDDGRLGEAIEMLEQVSEAKANKLGADHPDTLVTLGNLAVAYRDAGRLTEAIKMLEQVRDAAIKKLGPDHPIVLTAISGMALVYHAAGRLPEAIELFGQVRDAQVKNLGADHPATLSTLNALAAGYHAARRLPEAIELFEQVRDARVTKLGADHPDSLGIMHELAVAYKDVGRLPEAIELFEQVRDGRAKMQMGDDHPSTLTTLHNLAVAYKDVGRLPEAFELFEQVRDARVAKLGADHPATLQTVNALAATYWAAHQLDKSVPLFEDVIKRQEARLGRQHPDTQLTIANLGVNYKDAGRLKEAIPLLEETYLASRQIASLRGFGAPLLDAYVKAGKTAEATKLAQEQIADARKTFPQRSAQLAGALAQFGLTMLNAKAWTDAESILRETLAIRETEQPDDWTTFNTRSILGGALAEQEKYVEAEPLLVAGYEGMIQRQEHVPPQGKVRLSEALERLVQFYEAVEKPDEAAKWRKVLQSYVEEAPK